MMAFVFLYKETGDSFHHVKIQQNSSCLQARKGTLIRNQTMISDFPASRNKVCLNKYERPFHVPRVPNLACVLVSFCSFFNTQQRLPSPCSLPRPTRAQACPPEPCCCSVLPLGPERSNPPELTTWSRRGCFCSSLSHNDLTCPGSTKLPWLPDTLVLTPQPRAPHSSSDRMERPYEGTVLEPQVF
ncbi:uncharacterized protein LOC114679403 [Macaca mulatta]